MRTIPYREMVTDDVKNKKSKTITDRYRIAIHLIIPPYRLVFLMYDKNQKKTMPKELSGDDIDHSEIV